MLSVDDRRDGYARANILSRGNHKNPYLYRYSFSANRYVILYLSSTRNDLYCIENHAHNTYIIRIIRRKYYILIL